MGATDEQNGIETTTIATGTTGATETGKQVDETKETTEITNSKSTDATVGTRTGTETVERKPLSVSKDDDVIQVMKMKKGDE